VPVGSGTTGGSYVFVGGAGSVVVGGAGGGAGAVVRRGVVGVLLRVVGAGSSGIVLGPAGLPAVVVGAFFGVVRATGGRDARVAGFDARGATGFFTTGFCWDAGLACWAGVALAMAAVTPPVAITAVAATPFVTSESRRSARSREWTGGDAIDSQAFPRVLD
jgi:hypothetical protein